MRNTQAAAFIAVFLTTLAAGAATHGETPAPQAGPELRHSDPSASGVALSELEDYEPREPAARIEYPVDPAALKAAWNATGRVNVTLPDRGNVSIVAFENDFFVHKRVVVMGENGTVVDTYPITSIPLKGWLEGAPATEARITLGMYGVYGTLYAEDGVRYDFIPEERDGAYVQVVEKRVPGPGPRG